MTPGLTIREHGRIRIRQLREDDIPRMAAGGFGGEEGAKRSYAQELEKPDGPPGVDGKQLAVETKDGVWIGFTGFGVKRDGDAGGYFYIAEPFRRQGYGTELVQCVLRVMFEDCGSARCIAFAFPFLALVNITGAIWAYDAWGRFWGWDPKETWSLITWLVYAFYLHARLRSGWRGAKANWVAIIGFAVIMFTFVGVNRLASFSESLHSYASGK